MSSSNSKQHSSSENLFAQSFVENNLESDESESAFVLHSLHKRNASGKHDVRCSDRSLLDPADPEKCLTVDHLQNPVDIEIIEYL